MVLQQVLLIKRCRLYPAFLPIRCPHLLSVIFGDLRQNW